MLLAAILVILIRRLLPDQINSIKDKKDIGVFFLDVFAFSLDI